MVRFIGVGYVLILLAAAVVLSGCGVERGGDDNLAVINNDNVLCSSNSMATVELVAGLPMPTRRAGIGNAHLQITTDAVVAQYWFDQGLNYLHGFWYIEAYRAFQQVVALDPDCAMGHWGITMCQPGFGGDDFTTWQNSIDRAEELSGPCAPIEKELIKAMKLTINQGIIGAKANWQRLTTDFSHEPDVVALASIMLRQLVQNDEESDAVKAVLDKALKRYPDHVGLLHYYVHLLEVRPDFYLAESAAERLVQVAPNNSHLVHMPGHIHFLNGAYQKAAEAFEGARTQEQAYHKEQGIPAAIDQNYLHNLHYLSIVYSELNEHDQALTTAKQFASSTLRQNTPPDGASLMLLYEGRILPALVHIRFGEYREAAKEIGFWLTTPVVPLTNELVRDYLSAIQNYCYAMDFALRGDRQRSFDYADQMIVHFNRFSQLELSGPTEETMAMQAYDIMNVLRYELAGWLNNMDKEQPFYAEDWQAAQAAEDALSYDEPPRLMYPVAESQARLHLLRGEPDDSRLAAERALKKRPNSPLIQRALSIELN